MPLDSAPVFSILDRITDADGNPVAGGTVEFYQAGTTTPKTVYSDATLTTSLGTSVSTDAGGYPVSGGGAKVMIYVGIADYKVVVKDSGGSTLITHDNIPGAVEIPTTSDTATPETPVVSRTSTYTILSTDQGKLINADPTGGSFAITLPSAVTVGDGWRIGVRHAGASTSYVVTVRTTGGQTIGTSGQSAATSISLTGLGHTMWFVSDGAGWSVDTEVPPLMGGGLPYFKAVSRLTAPPSSPSGGDRYIINGTPTGVWSSLGYAENDIAESNGNGSWNRYAPQSGYKAWIEAEGLESVYHDSAWVDWSNVTAPTSSAQRATLATMSVSSGTAGTAITPGAYQTLTLNTLASNSLTTANGAVSDAALSSNTLTVPPGTYKISAGWLIGGNYSADNYNITTQVYNVTGSARITSAGVTTRNLSSTTSYSQWTHVPPTPVTFSVTTQLQLQATVAQATNLGRPSAAGHVETFAYLLVEDLASMQGPRGEQGVQGVDGLDAAYPFQWSTSTSGDPGTGKIAGNSATLSSITALAISETQSDGGPIGNVIGTWDDSTNPVKGAIRISKEGETQNYIAFQITGSIVDSGNYRTVPVAYVGASGTIADGDDCAVLPLITGDKGETGPTGAAGVSPFDYTFDTGTTDANPGTGKVRANNANLSSATSIYISETDRLGNSQSGAIQQFDDSTSSVRGYLTIVDLSTPANRVRYQITGSVIDGGSYDKITVTYVSGVTSLTAVNVALLFERSGDVGATNLSYTASPTNGVVTSDTGTDATIPLADATNAGLLKPADFSKLALLTPDGIELESYGGGTGVSDNASALNSAVAALSAAGTRYIRLRAGVYNFTTKPTDFTTGVLIVGDGMSNTALVRNYSAASDDEGFLTWSGSGSMGGGIERVQIHAGNATTGGTCLKFVTGSSDVAGYHAIADIVSTYTGTGYWYRNLLVDGVLNTTLGSQGLRDFRVSRAFLFKSASGAESARFVNATNLSVDALWSNGDIIVYGGGTATSNTIDANINVICLGQLFVGNAKYVSARGVVDSVNFSSGSEMCSFSGVVQTITGGIADTGANNSFLTSSGVKNPGYITSASATGGVGYATGAGGAVTQSTSKSTGVTLSKTCGQITMNNASLAASTAVSFTLTNTAIAATDVLVLNHVAGGAAGSYMVNAQCGSGSALITVRNVTAGSLSDAVVLAFALVKGVTS